MRTVGSFGALLCLVLFLCPWRGQAQPAPATIGTIPGAFTVTLGGSANYSVPISVVPGRAGTSPKLQFVYDSQSVGNVMGAGWSITGISAITRGPKDSFTDGVISGVSIEESDALYLDGARIVPIRESGAGLSHVIEYRKVTDDQTRITRTGPDFGNSIFKVQTKGGVTLVYNGTNGSRIPLADGSVLAMAQSIAIDSAGNYIEYVYDNNGKGNYEVKSIRYTGHGLIDLNGQLQSDSSPFASVEFTYEATSRPLLAYVAGRQIVKDVRLTSVSSSLLADPAKPLSKYVPEYEERNSASRFVLSKLHQFGSDGTEIAPTSFTYSKPAVGWTPAEYAFPNSAVLAGVTRLGLGYRFVHFAPTGQLPDLLFAAQVEGKLTSFAFRNDLNAKPPAQQTWTALETFKPPVAFVNGDGGDLGVIVADVTGDGRADILQAYQQTGSQPVFGSYVSGPNGFDSAPGYVLPFVVSQDGKIVSQYRLAKFSGNAGPDIIFEAQGVRGFRKNLRGGWEAQQDTRFVPPVPVNDRLRVVDVDCSGRAALVSAVATTSGHFEWQIFRYNSLGWKREQDPRFVPPFSAETDPRAIREVRFDSRANSCAGLVVATATNGGLHGAYEASGQGWKVRADKTPSFDLVDSNGIASDAVVADVNGDGLSDVIANTQLADGSVVRFAFLQKAAPVRGSSWQDSGAYYPPLLSTHLQHANSPSVFVGDIDGRPGDDVIDINDTRPLSGRPSADFGHIYISAPSGYQLKPDYAPPVQFARKDKQDRGVRVVDLHGTGLPDVIFRRDVTLNGVTTKAQGAYRNTGRGWVEEPGLMPPEAFASDDIPGSPVQFADVSGSGFNDMIYSYKDKDGNIHCHLYQNVPDTSDTRKWSDVSTDTPSLSNIVPPTCKATSDGKVFPLSTYRTGDVGVRFLKLDKNRLGMLVGFMPYNSSAPAQNCTKDINGKVTNCALNRSAFQVAAYTFDGDHWSPAPQYAPPVPFVAQLDQDGPSQDLFVQLIDVNQDGLPDIVARFRHPKDPNLEVHEVWLNTGSGWKLDPSMQVPYALDAPRREPKALVQWADVNGDGIPDLVLSKRDGGTNNSATWLGTGRGWEATTTGWQVPIDAIADKDGDPGFRLVDVNGDGFPDILYGIPNANGTPASGVFLNNGSDWKTKAPDSSVPNFSFVDNDGLDQGVRVFSVTGTGVADIVQSFGGSVPRILINSSRRSDILSNIAEGGIPPGVGLQTRLYYRTLLEADSNISGTPSDDGMPENLMAKRPYERGLPDAFPLVAPAPTTYVVRRATVDEGHGRTESFSYRYGNYRADASSMRSLGFGWRESLNEVNGILARSEFFQDSRLVGQTKRSATCWLPLHLWGDHPASLPPNLCPEGPSKWASWAQKLEETSYCSLVVEGDSSGGAAVEQQVCWNDKISALSPVAVAPPYRLRQTSPSKAVTAQYELDGLLVSENTDSFRYDSPPDILKRHANALVVKSVLKDGSYLETENEYADDEARWFLGRLSSTKATKGGGAVASGATERMAETHRSIFSYDRETGLLLQETSNVDSVKALTTSFDRDRYGNIIASAVSAPGQLTRISRDTFDSEGRFATSHTNSLGQTSVSNSDPRSGLTATSNDPNGVKSGFEYDGFGRLQRQISASGVESTTKLLTVSELKVALGGLDVSDGVPASFASVTRTGNLPPTITVFDNKSRPVRVITDGFTVDAAAHRYIYKDTTYDLLGQPEATSLPYELGRTILWGKTVRDVLGRVVKTVTPDSITTTTSYSGIKSNVPRLLTQSPPQTCADILSGPDVGGGEIVTVTRDTKGVAHNSYACTDMRKQLLLSVDAAKGSVRFKYDAGGRLLEMVGPSGATTTHTYDEVGNRIRTSDPDFGTWTYEYDAFGKVVRQIDAKNQVAVLEYDALGRPIRRIQPDLITSWYYDTAPHGVGKLAKIENSNGYLESYSYNILGRPNARTVRVDKEAFTTSSTYDRYGRPDTIYYPSSFAVRNHFDAKGFLVAVSDVRDSFNYWTAKAIDQNGRVTEEAYGNGVTTARLYDDTSGRPLRIKSSINQDGDILDLALKYDSFGNLLSRAEAVDKIRETFTYDSLDRLASMDNSAGATTNYQFDAAGRMTHRDGVGDFQYADEQGEVNGDYAKPFHAAQETKLGNKLELYQYDRNGNMISQPQGHIEYTSDNRVRLIYSSENQWRRFDYSPNGDRFRQHQVLGRQTVETLYVGIYERITEYVPPFTSQWNDRLVRHRHYLTNGAQVFAVVETNAQYANSSLDCLSLDCPRNALKINGENLNVQTWYLHSDQLGSILRVTDSIATVREKMWYDPWGARTKVVSAEPATGVALKQSWQRGFTAHEHADEFSLIHMNGRVFSPILAAFLSVDSINQAISDTQAGNGYMYARGNPLKYIDPTGQGWLGDAWHAVTAPFRAVGDALGSAAQGVGHFFSEAGKWVSENWKTIVVVAVVIVVTIATDGSGTEGAVSWGDVILSGMAAGAAGGATSAALYGGSIDDILQAAIKGAVIGGISAAAFYGVGEFFQPQTGQAMTVSSRIESVAAHGVVGGAKAAAEGGNFWKGFVAGAATKASAFGPTFADVTANTARAAIIGGTVSAMTGDKFANGAIIGAFSYRFNCALHPETSDVAASRGAASVKAPSVMSPEDDAIYPTVGPIDVLVLGAGAAWGVGAAFLEGLSEQATIEYTLTRTVENGLETRPYLESPLLIREIESTGSGVPDPGGIPGALRYDVPGSFGKSQGTYEMVITPKDGTIWHFLFRGGK